MKLIQKNYHKYIIIQNIKSKKVKSNNQMNTSDDNKYKSKKKKVVNYQANRLNTGVQKAGK